MDSVGVFFGSGENSTPEILEDQPAAKLDRPESVVHVLLVEDNLGDARLTQIRLADGPFRTSTVSRISEALAVVAAATPDVVLTDLQLPDASGMEAVQRLRAALPSTPIVVFTGAEDSDAGTVAIRNGADDYLPKDEVTSALLRRTLRHAIERRAATRSLVAHITDGVVVLDSDGAVRFANAAAIDLFGRPRVSLLGRRLDLPTISADGVEIELAAPGQASRVVEVSSNPIRWHDQPATLLSLHDVTERRRADELRARLERADRLAAMGVLAASVAHEINNALAILSVNLPVLAEDLARVLTTQDSEVFDDCLLAVERIANIVREMHGYGRDRRSDIQLIDANEIISDAIRLVGPQLRHRARLDQELGELPRIAIDPGHLTQIVVNLLLNAADATESRGRDGVVVVSTRSDGETITIGVSDNGSGVPEDLRSRIFDPFFTTKSSDRGTGLGLSVIADLARRYGGSVTLESQAGAGARFDVRLPVNMVPAPERDAVARPRSGSPLSELRILVIDDDRAVGAAIGRMLATAREVLVVDSGARGLEEIERDPSFDAVVCDVMMFDMDGAEVLAQIKARFPDLASRVLFVTGGVMTERARRLLVSDVRVVEKPVSRALLESAIISVVKSADPPA